MPEHRYVSVEAVLAYIERTLEHGVPMRVALIRAERRYGVKRDFVRQFLRANQK